MASQPSLLMLILVLVALISEYLVVTASSEWAYTGTFAPERWPGKCLDGNYQSPIDIGEMGIEERSFEPLAMINYVGYPNMTVTNNGHTAQIAVHHPNRATLTGGGLPGVYLLEQIHFHWPSEHTFLGKQHPLEVHFVHYEHNYVSLDKAVYNPEGIAVLAVLFHESASKNSQLDPLIETVQSVGVKTYTTKPVLRSQKLMALIPRDTSKFYRYHGSLTTPGCNESVVWTIFTETLAISKTQLQAFRQLKTKSGSYLDHNNRPLQPQNDRIVYFQTGPLPHIAWTSASYKPQTGYLLMFMFVVVARMI